MPGKRMKSGKKEEDGLYESQRTNHLLSFFQYSCDIGTTALHVASMIGHHEVVELLLQKGAKVDERKHGGDTSLHMACMRGHKMVIERLLSYGADMQLTLALLVACEKGRMDIVELLLARGADVRVTDGSLQTALHVTRNVDIVDLLIGRGADVNARYGRERW